MVRWTTKAEGDLLEIQEHIARNFNSELAIRLVGELVDRIERILDANPLAGAILPQNPLFSKIVIDGNAFYYCEHPQTRDVVVIYVQARHSEADPSRFVGPR